MTRYKREWWVPVVLVVTLTPVFYSIAVVLLR